MWNTSPGSEAAKNERPMSYPKPKPLKGALIRFQAHDAHFEYKVTGRDGTSKITSKDKSSRVEYGFKGSFFNSAPENMGLSNIKVIFKKGDDTLRELVPRPGGEVEGPSRRVGERERRFDR